MGLEKYQTILSFSKIVTISIIVLLSLSQLIEISKLNWWVNVEPKGKGETLDAVNYIFQEQHRTQTESTINEFFVVPLQISHQNSRFIHEEEV